MATINGTSGSDNLKGTAAADRINGRDGDDILSGGKGDDTLAGGDGVDTLKGGAGNDLYLVTPGLDVIADTGGFDTVIATDTGTWTLASGLEVLILRGNALVNVGPSNTLSGYGNDLDNTIRNERTGYQPVILDGGGGDDVLLGRDGQDIFRFSSGNDYVDGAGNGSGLADILSFTSTSAALVVDFNDGFAWGEAGSVTFENIEEVWGSASGDRFIGSAAFENVHGGGGNDTFAGGGSHDVAYGDNGDDRLIGGAGRDGLTGGLGNDYIDGGTGIDAINGNEGNDRIIWDSRDFGIHGGDGNDTLVLREGNMNLTAIPDDKVTGVDLIDMTGSGNNRLTLSREDVLAIEPGGSALFVTGDAGDSINIVGEFTYQGRGEDGWDYYRFGEQYLFLAVDPEVSHVF